MKRDIWVNSLGEVGRSDMGGVIAEADLERLLSPKELLTVRRTHRIQDAVNDSRFRVWLGEKHVIWLTAEFIYFSDEKDLEKGIRWLACQLGARVFLMIEHPHLDHSWRVDGAGKKIKATERYGEDHGRMEKQIEFAWAVYTVAEARVLKRQMKRATQQLWANYGVNVI